MSKWSMHYAVMQPEMTTEDWDPTELYTRAYIEGDISEDAIPEDIALNMQLDLMEVLKIRKLLEGKTVMEDNYTYNYQ